ncbi:Di-copper centre-containing protein, partial [Lophium mytilinum]
TCTSSNIAVRRPWDDLSTPERLAYISAVKCMTTLPSLTPSSLAPGARNRLDDFVYAHINVTNLIHLSGLLLPWHRQFIWSWEHALRNECGYTGYLPYWDWARHSKNLTSSPVFGPGPATFGSNGENIPHHLNATSPLIGLPPPGVTVPRVTGTGGGCVKDGPFAGMTLHLGPVSPSYNDIPNNEFGTQYNPRCLKRDFHQPSATGNMTYEAIASLLQTRSIADFRPQLEHPTGVHISGHNFLGGDGGDTYSSPNEPLFFLHHAQIDRLWTIWQGQDIGGRRGAVDGTMTVANVPPSENATLESVMKMGAPAGGDLPIAHAMLTVGNDYCYMYV